MNCLNCSQPLQQPNGFCSQCGAKVVMQRITTQSIWKDFATDYIGWDNRYFVTVWKMIVSPDVVLESYLSGVRKRYVKPFAFLAIGTALAVLIFNAYSDHYVEASTSLNEKQFEFFQVKLGKTNNVAELATEKAKYLEETKQSQKQLLKYLNLLTFLILPFYALLSLLIFGKRHNYAEHLVINCYVQGVGFLSNIVFFLLSLLISPVFYYLSFAVIVSYYLYVYKQLNKYTFGTVLIKLFKFIGLLLLSGVVLFVVGFLVGSIL